MYQVLKSFQNGVCTLKKIDEQKLDSVNVESADFPRSVVFLGLPVYSERTQV